MWLAHVEGCLNEGIGAHADRGDLMPPSWLLNQHWCNTGEGLMGIPSYRAEEDRSGDAVPKLLAPVLLAPHP